MAAQTQAVKREAKVSQGVIVSDTDSFIDEVTEEVRRDRLFALVRKYGWIGVLAVLLLVGGAAWNEWRKAQDTAQAQALGDGLLTALTQDTPEAALAQLDQLPTDRAGATLVTGFAKAAQHLAAGDTQAAVAQFETLATDAQIAPAYRQLASFRALTLASTRSTAERRLGFEALLQSTGILRLLAEEQLALLDIEEGNSDAAKERLYKIIADAETTAGLRRRAAQLIVALGGSVPQAG